MKNINLTIKERVIAAGFFVLIFITLCYFFNQKNFSFLTDTSNSYNILFISGALLLILGSYIVEPFFTKPVDVITNSIAVILALLSIQNPSLFVGYSYILISAFVILLSSITLIFISNIKKTSLTQSIFLDVLTKVGQSKVLFSIIYLSTLVSFFSDKPMEFAFFITFWIIFITHFVVEGFIKYSSNIFDRIINRKKYTEILGQAIGCENPFLYIIEVDFLKHQTKSVKIGQLVYLSLIDNLGAIGLVINEKQLLNKKWITVYLLEEDGAPLKINFRNNSIVSGVKTIFSNDNAVYSFDLTIFENSTQKEKIENNYLYKNKNNFIGYIAEGSDINKIKFRSLIGLENDKHLNLKEGTVIKTKIYNIDTLFQIIDGKTNEEELEKHNLHGYLVGVALKLGQYAYEKIEKTGKDGKKVVVSEGELKTVKWVPNIYTPVFFDDSNPEKKNEMAVGKLPTTNLEIIIKDPDSLVTHNTAILGILGIGKSCLTFELIQKITINTASKIVCIDITNEYKKKLVEYVDSNLQKSDDESAFNSVNTSFDYIHYEKNSEGKNVANHEKSGNQDKYREELRKDLMNFFFSAQDIPTNEVFSNNLRIRIYNPDYHKVSKGEKVGFNAIATELSQAEKTRIICEEVFRILRKLKLTEDNKAKALIVFEEAHSLVPEWNSTANDGDKTAVNGTAKIILQGRKYGLGSFVVTQRTANISKSILNQCNTIFALRVFDDTGKQFLENYIGTDYSNTLPTLEERSAIAVGKGLKLKQPVIIELNDRNDIIANKQQTVI